jgi:hypothetical protein
MMSKVIHVCCTEVRSFRSHRYVGDTRVASWDNQLVKTHAVALVGDTAESETVCGTTIEGEVLVESAFTEQDLWRRCYRCAELLGLPVPPD